MKRLFPILGLLLLGLPTGCTYDLDVEGKQCNATHPCPSGYFCIPSSDGGSVCKPGEPDGGTDGGDDGGDTGPCQEGETRCKDGDPSVLLICQEGGDWQETDCLGPTYCFYVSELVDVVGCMPDCENTEDCERDGYFCNPETSHCEEKGDCSPPGQKQCLYQGGSNDAVEECNAETGAWDVTSCGDTEYCHENYIECLEQCTFDPDCTGLPDDNSCNPINHKCKRIDYCPTIATCGAGVSCIPYDQGACVLNPSVNAITTGNASGADLQCFKDAVASDDGAATECTLDGYVPDLISSGSGRTGDTIGLTVEIHELGNILNGDDDSAHALSTTTVVDEGAGNHHGHYQFADPVPTKQELVLIVRAGPGSNDEVYATTYTFGIYVRADECDAGNFSVDAPVITSDLYDTYFSANYTVAENPDRGMLAVRLIDCTGLDRLIGGTVGTTLETERSYYIMVDGVSHALIPDLDAIATLETGWFIGSSVLPIRGLVSARVKDPGSLVTLGSQMVRVYPGAASVIVFSTPKKPD